jgi:hypothetical protein
LEAIRRVLEKLEKLNQTKEQIERMQWEIEEMKEQENSSLCHDTPHQNSGKKRRTPKENFFAGNGILQFADPYSPLSIGLQTAPWPPKFKPVSLSKYNSYGNSMQFLMRYESTMNSVGGEDIALDKSFIIACEGPVLNRYSTTTLNLQHSKYSMKQQLNHQICTIASREIESHCGTL